MTTRNAIIVMSAAFSVGLLGTAASAEDFCVANSAELQQALDDAEGNGEADVIRLMRGDYPVTGNMFFYGSSEPYGLTIEGDYTEFMGDCMRWTPPTPWDTVLTGQNLNQVMRLDFYSDQPLFVRVESLTIQNGVYSGSGPDAAGLSIIIGGGNQATVEVENNAFLANHGSGIAGGLVASAEGDLRVINNLFAFNQGGVRGAASLTGNGDGLPSPCVEILNNTVVGNTSSGDDDGGIRIGGSCPSCFVDNNILWGNYNDDLVLSTSLGLACHLDHNDIEDYTGTPASMTGNMSVDPQFAGLIDYRLAPGSPLVDAGIERLNAPLPLTDLDALPRIAGLAIDIGGFERWTLFDDGFESGDTSAWTATTPTP